MMKEAKRNLSPATMVVCILPTQLYIITEMKYIKSGNIYKYTLSPVSKKLIVQFLAFLFWIKNNL